MSVNIYAERVNNALIQHGCSALQRATTRLVASKSIRLHVVPDKLTNQIEQHVVRSRIGKKRAGNGWLFYAGFRFHF